MAAAIGAGLPVSEPTGSMVVDIGGGTSEVAVISLGDVVTSNSARVAGDNFDESIINYIKKKYNLLIGERTAEDIKIKIGSAYPYEGEGAMNIKGRNLMDGLPKNIEISAEEIREALSDSVNQILDVIKATLEKTPPSSLRTLSTTASCSPAAALCSEVSTSSLPPRPASPFSSRRVRSTASLTEQASASSIRSINKRLFAGRSAFRRRPAFSQAYKNYAAQRFFCLSAYFLQTRGIFCVV